jgi:hypothetical protein
MKSVKNFVYAVLLVSALAINSFAGEQETPGVYTPPPPRATANEETTIKDSNDQTGGVAAETSDYLFFEALAAILSIY